MFRAKPGGPLRVEGSLMVSRAIGDFAYKEARNLVLSTPDVTQVVLDENCDFIIVATDGGKSMIVFLCNG